MVKLLLRLCLVMDKKEKGKSITHNPSNGTSEAHWSSIIHHVRVILHPALWDEQFCECGSGYETTAAWGEIVSELQIMDEPPGRRGACSFIHDEKLYIHHGSNQQRENVLPSYDLRTTVWSEASTAFDTSTARRGIRVISGEAFTVVKNALCTFGGWCDGARNSSVWELDLNTFIWRECVPKNPSEGPMPKDKAGMVAYGGDMLCVFGGYGDARNGIIPQSGAQYHTDMTSPWGFSWTNELHLFHLKDCES